MTTPTRGTIGRKGGQDCNDITGCTYHAFDGARWVRLSAGRTYQERATRWVQRGPWQVRGLHIECGWAVGR